MSELTKFSLGLVALLMLALFPSPEAMCQENRGALLVLGAGNSGNWVSEYVLANSTASPSIVGIGSAPEYPTVIPPLGYLDLETIVVPPHGTVATAGPKFGFPVFFIQSVSGPTVAARARTYNSLNPLQGSDLPIFRVATLQPLNPSKLVFPIRPGSTRVNLLLINLRDAGQYESGSVVLRITALTESGQERGARDLGLGFGQAIYLVDLGRYLGTDALESGQVRVERVTGTGNFWGVMPSIGADGSMATAIGYIP